MKSFLFLNILFIFLLGCTMRYVPDRTISAGRLSIFAQDWNKRERNAVVLIHAGFQDHTMWEKQVEALKDDYRVVVIDLPGHGRTTGVDTNILVQNVIRIVLDSLGISKASFIGLSLGSVCVQDFAIAYPDRVNKIILLSPGLNGLDKVQPIDSLSEEWWPRMRAALREKDTVGAAEVFTKTWAEGPYRSDSLKKPVSVYVFRSTLRNIKIHKMKGWPGMNTQPIAVERIATVSKPVLIVHGDKDLPYVAQASVYLEKNIPGAKRILMKDVAHMINLEKPGELNEIMIEFLGH